MDINIASCFWKLSILMMKHSVCFETSIIIKYGLAFIQFFSLGIVIPICHLDLSSFVNLELSIWKENIIEDDYRRNSCSLLHNQTSFSCQCSDFRELFLNAMPVHQYLLEECSTSHSLQHFQNSLN